MLGQITFFPKNTSLPGDATFPGNFESNVFDCSGADTLVSFLRTHYARGTSPTLDVQLFGSEDLEAWTLVGSMTQATDGDVNERKQFQNLRGWHFLKASVSVGAGSGDSDFVMTLSGELFQTNAAGT